MTNTGALINGTRSMLGKMSQQARSREGVMTRRPDEMGECRITPRTGRVDAK